MIDIAQQRGRAFGKEVDLAEFEQDGWAYPLAQIAARETRDLVPRHRWFFTKELGLSVGLATILIVAGFVVTEVVPGDASETLGGFIGIGVVAVWIFGTVAAIRADSRKSKLADEQRAWLAHCWYLDAVDVALDRIETAQAEYRARPAPAPDPQRYGVSPRGAERIVCDWMRHLGALDATTTAYVGDGGVDVESTNWIAQVKHYQGSVGVQAIRELAGVASVDGRSALFFTSTGYAPGAAAFADRARVGLFVYSAEQGTLHPANELGRSLFARGLS